MHLNDEWSGLADFLAEMIPHIAPAEKAGEEQLLNDIEKALKG